MLRYRCPAYFTVLLYCLAMTFQNLPTATSSPFVGTDLSSHAENPRAIEFTPPSSVEILSPSQLGLPANFTFPPLDRPPVVNGIAQLASGQQQEFELAAISNITESVHSAQLGPSSTSSSDSKIPSSSSTVVPFSNSTIKENIANKSLEIQIDAADTFWLANIAHGSNPFAPTSYQFYRNVKDFGAVGDGVTDDTAAINAAVSAGPRCTPSLAECNSTSVLGALVYVPPGTYLISAPIFLDFYTQFIGSPLDRPTIKGSADFDGIALLDTDFYIPNENGEEWYQNQNNFYRSVRNLILDLTSMQAEPDDANGIPTGIHWQVAQATSLQNILFMMTQGGIQQGIFMENGSGGFLSDLVFQFGAIGMRIGSQQFTMRNLVFNNCITGIQTIWDWAFTFQNIQMNSIGIAIDARGGPNTGPNGQPFGSMSLIDSVFNSVNIVVFLAGSDPNAQLPQVLLDNVQVTNLPGSTSLVETAGGQVIFSVSEAQTITSWARGKVYSNITDDGSGSTFATAESLSPTPNKPAGLLDASTGQFFTRSRPQYEQFDVSSFVSVTDFGAVGDADTDDTAALNTAFAQANAEGNILFVPMGVYLVTDTVVIPTGSRVVGEGWAQIMGTGSAFGDSSTPHVMVQVGNSGDVGTVEISDLLFTVRAPTPGAVLMEWNVLASSQGAAAMWDSHFRVGGAIGSNLEASNCPTLTGAINSNCVAASILLHITSSASAYMENIWAWVSDHDIDIPAQTQVDVYSARGILVESQNPTWLYGTASEHSVLYQYQVSNAQNLFMGFMQTESPYYQPSPLAPAPFENSLLFANDPVFGNCVTGSASNCARAWALRIINSTDVLIYGAGFYSFFQDYDQTCVNDGSETCQDALIDIANSERLFIYDLVTIGAQQVITPEGGVIVNQKDTQFFFVTTVIAYLGLAVEGANQGGLGTGLGDSLTPTGVSIIPIPDCTTVAPQATFTLTQACVGPIANLTPSGADNVPPGPPFCPLTCDLFRLLTATCCGIDGTVGNPIVIEPNVPLPAQLALPSGYTPTSPFTDRDGTVHPANTPLPSQVIVDAGTEFSDPLVVPSNISLPLPGTVPEFDHMTGQVPILPLPCTTVAPSATFTMSAECVPGITALPISSSQNTPPGPSSCHDNCSLFRRLTGTCCGIGGFLINPVLIPPIPLPFFIIFPPAFVFPFDFTIGPITIFANMPLLDDLIIPPAFVFPGPLLIPPLLELEDDAEEEEEEDDDDDVGGTPDLTTTFPANVYMEPATGTQTLSAQMLDIGLILAFAANFTSGEFTPPFPTATTTAIAPSTTANNPPPPTTTANNPPPPPSPSLAIAIYFDSASDDGGVGDLWVIFDTTPGVVPDVCTAIDNNTEDLRVLAGGNVGSNNPPFLSGSSTFTSHGIAGCVYSGTSSEPGTLACPGLEQVNCALDPQEGMGVVISCLDPDGLGENSFQPQVVCEF